jgi:hypothetical protein
LFAFIILLHRNISTIQGLVHELAPRRCAVHWIVNAGTSIDYRCETGGGHPLERRGVHGWPHWIDRLFGETFLSNWNDYRSFGMVKATPAEQMRRMMD